MLELIEQIYEMVKSMNYPYVVRVRIRFAGDIGVNIYDISKDSIDYRGQFYACKRQNVRSQYNKIKKIFESGKTWLPID